VIEDEAQIRANLSQLLVLHGFEVSTASNGQEGISQALLSKPDLVLCDIMMPVVDGYQVLRVLRQHRSLGQVPFIFLTAKAEGVDLRRGMVLGADDYLTKPFGMADLLAAIQSRLKREADRKADLQAKLMKHRQALSNVSVHEYNTPLNSILGFADLLIDNYNDFDTEDTVSMLNMIKVCGFQLKRSLDNVKRSELLQGLTPSHNSYPYYSTGQTTITTEMVEKQIQTVAYRLGRVVPYQAAVEESVLRLSDENLKIILDELLDNAFKFTESGHSVTVSGQRQGADYRLTVTNQGRVFKREDVVRIAPYVQFDRGEYEQQGLGLGLSLVKKILELNNGTLEINSLDSQTTLVSVLFQTTNPA